MKNIDFNLATTPFYESLIADERFLLLSSTPEDGNKTFDVSLIKKIAADLLKLAEIPYAHLEATIVEKNENGLTDFVKVTFESLSKQWDTGDMYFDRTMYQSFAGGRLMDVLNKILESMRRGHRFFTVYNDFWKNDVKYRLNANILWADRQLTNQLMVQLQSHDFQFDLLNSENKFSINQDVVINNEINYQSEIEIGRFAFSALLPKNSQEIDITEDFETEFRKTGIQYFPNFLRKYQIPEIFLWCSFGTSRLINQFIGEVLAKYLKDKIVKVNNAESLIEIELIDKKAYVPSFFTENNYNRSNNYGIVRTLNSLLKHYQITDRIYTICNDLREPKDAESYFICDEKIGEQIFDLLNRIKSVPEAWYNRLEVYLADEEQELSAGIYKETQRTFSGIAVPNGAHWENLFAHFLSLNDHRRMPSERWYKKSKELINVLGESDFMDLGVKWLLKCIEKSEANQRNTWLGLVNSHQKIAETLIGEAKYTKESPKWLIDVYGDKTKFGSFFPAKAHVMNNSSNYFYYSFGGRILRGFMHCSPLVSSKELIHLVDKFVATNPNECADAIHVYTQLPIHEGVPKITRIRSKIKKRNIQIRVETALKEIGKKLKLTTDQVEELSLSDFDMTNNHELNRQIGDFTARFKVENYKKTSLIWLNANGKEQNAVPSAVKTNFANELKELKADIKDIENQLPVQKERIENFYLKNRRWMYQEWFALYIAHPLIGVLGKQLIWHFDNGKSKSQGIWNGQTFVDAQGNTLMGFDEQTQVQLWHPIGFTADYIVDWRNFLIKNQITQPFKQAFREVYILTDAELNTHSYSNRFASHILNRDHFSALCKARGWTPNAMATGQPTKRVASENIMVEYWVNEVWLGQHNNFSGSAHVTTDQVRFYRNKVQLNMEDVPAILFSELMRDIDLFVGVTSIANDPNWQDNGDGQVRTYWDNYAYGDLSESSKMREEVLKNLIPRLKMASKCSFEGKFLKVKGSFRTYKIHIGSGNILMEPNDQYLCIVADATKSNPIEKLYLPFESDNMLSIIVSKAMLLANDDKITDATITRQIRP